MTLLGMGDDKRMQGQSLPTWVLLTLTAALTVFFVVVLISLLAGV